MRCALPSLILVGAIACIGAPKSVLGQATLEVRESPLRRTVPLADPAPRAISFLVYARGGNFCNVGAQVIDIRDPLGSSVPSAALTADTIGAVTLAGTPVRFSVDVTQFYRHGDYQVFLVIVGRPARGKADTLTKTLVLTRPAATVNVAEWSGRAVAFKRRWPFGSVSGDNVMLRLFETSGTADIMALEAAGGEMYSKDVNTVVAGRADLTSPTREIGAGGSANLQLRVSGLKPGSMKTRLVISSPSLTQRETTELNVIVSDQWWVALICIGVGVALAWFLTRIVTKARPQAKNAAMIQALTEQIDDLRRVCTQSSDLATLVRLGVVLRQAERQNRLGDVQGAEQLLKSIASELKNLPSHNVTLGKPIAERYETTLSKLDSAYKERLRAIDLAVAVTSMAVASGIGLLALYFGAQWGGVEDFLKAALWGFGIDTGVKGFAPVFTKLNRPIV